MKILITLDYGDCYALNGNTIVINAPIMREAIISENICQELRLTGKLDKEVKIKEEVVTEVVTYVTVNKLQNEVVL